MRKLSDMFCFLILLLPTALRAQDFNWITNADNASVTITAYLGNGGVVSIPSTITGLEVTGIGTNAFRFATNMTSLTIPDSVTNIGPFAFFGCSSMTNVTLPADVTHILDFTFYYCSNLTSVIIPNSVVTIGVESFYNCNGLKNLVLSTNLTSIGDHAFEDCSSLAVLTIPNSVTSLGYSTFGSCSSLASLSIPSSLKSITDNCFIDCYDLVNVTIPDSVTNVGYQTFTSCQSLRSISLSTNLTSLGADAFDNCLSLTNIVIPDGVTTIGDGTFNDCENLISIALPKYLTDIGGSAFFQCSSLGSLAVPNTVTNIGDGAFWFCEHLTSLTLSTNLTSIGNTEFFACISLSALTIPPSVTSIGEGAFNECNGLTTLIIPSGVSNLGSQALGYCPLLSSVYFLGNAPSADPSVLIMDNNPTVYYLAGTSGWSNTYYGFPAVMLNAPNPSGSLQVTINPTEATIAGAFWRVDGGIPQPSGATVVGLAVGSHTISFSNVGHWAIPADQIVTVTTNQTTSTSATYVVDAHLGTYAMALLSFHPAAYWQLNETNDVPAADIITNLGSLGLVGNGFPLDNVVQGLPGIVKNCATFSNPSLAVTYLGSHVSVPNYPPLNTAGPFTVEFWVKPNQITTDLFCPVSFIDGSQNSYNSRFGWLFYEGPGAQWVFSVGNFNGYVASITGGIVQTDVWQHIAGVYNRTNITLYVNGVSVAGPMPANGYSPNTNAAVALCIGATSLGNRTFDGSVDELSVYTNALSVDTIGAHYQAAFTNNGNYEEQVLSDHPVGYWSFDERSYTAVPPSSLPFAFNLGSLSSLAYGVYEPGVVPGQAGVPGIGFGATNFACRFVASSYIDVPGSALQFSGPLTLMAWVKLSPAFAGIQPIVSLGTNGYRLTVDSDGYPHFSDGIQSFGDLIATNRVDDNQWHQLAGTYDGTNSESLFVDGRLAVQSMNASTLPSPMGQDFWIGGDPDTNTFQFFDGVIDEVAIFTNALTANQLLSLSSAAAGGPLLAPPVYSKFSASVMLSWSAIPGLTYQLQQTTNLSQQNWMALSTNITAINAVVSISLPASSASQSFYRVLILP
jgi:hypothetical protein